MLPFLDPLWDHPAVAAFITGQLPSLLLIADMSLLPYVLQLIAKRVVGLVSEGAVTKWVVGHFYFFLILNVFLVSALSGVPRLRSLSLLRKLNHLQRIKYIRSATHLDRLF